MKILYTNKLLTFCILIFQSILNFHFLLGVFVKSNTGGGSEGSAITLYGLCDFLMFPNIHLVYTSTAEYIGALSLNSYLELNSVQSVIDLSDVLLSTQYSVLSTSQGYTHTACSVFLVYLYITRRVNTKRPSIVF